MPRLVKGGTSTRKRTSGRNVRNKSKTRGSTRRKSVHTKRKTAVKPNKTIPKMMVVCHGKKHVPTFKNAILVDIDKSARPDIVADIRAKNFISVSKLPTGHFKKIVLQFCPFYAYHRTAAFQNLKKLLHDDGVIILKNGLPLFLVQTAKLKTANDVKRYFKRYGLKVVGEHKPDPDKDKDLKLVK